MGAVGWGGGGGMGLKSKIVKYVLCHLCAKLGQQVLETLMLTYILTSTKSIIVHFQIHGIYHLW